MKKPGINFLSLLLAGTVFFSCNQKAESYGEESEDIAKDVNNENFETRDDKKEADFIVNSVSGNYAEVRLAQLALNKSGNSEVKEVASMLEKDHLKVLNELKTFAERKGIVVPNEENDNAREQVSDLASTEQADFDKKWCKELISKHEKTISTFETMWEKTEDAELKEWISQTLPDLRNHLVRLNACHEKMTM